MEKLPKEILNIGQEYGVTVLKILPAGIIVHLHGTDFTELIHISEISPDFVSNIAEYVTVGETYTAKAQVSKYGNKELSLKHLNLKRTSAPEDVTPKHMPKNPKSFEEMIAAAEDDLKSKQRGNRGLKKEHKGTRKPKSSNR